MPRRLYAQIHHWGPRGHRSQLSQKHCFEHLRGSPVAHLVIQKLKFPKTPLAARTIDMVLLFFISNGGVFDVGVDTQDTKTKGYVSPISNSDLTSTTQSIKSFLSKMKTVSSRDVHSQLVARIEEKIKEEGRP